MDRTMSNTIMLRPTSHRRQPHLLASKSVSSSVRFAEVAGGTTADCAAVCCCCPFVVVDIFVLAVYKVPAGLCRRAIRSQRRQRLKKNGELPARRGRSSGGSFDDIDFEILTAGKSVYSSELKGKVSDETEREVLELENEMWEIFYSTGFWRSSSQRDHISSNSN